jgi:hypothetical protein
MAADTSRARLEEMVGRYLEALVARDASSLRLAADLRFTENAQALSVSEGLWGTATAVETPQLVCLDPVNESAGFFALVHEHGEPVGLGVRLRVSDGAISEIETIVARPPALIFDPDGMKRPGPGFGDVDRAGRASRSELVAAANAYFDGIEQDEGGIIPARDDCVRVENGVRTVLADASTFGSSTADQGLNLFTMGVREQIDTGFFAYIPRIRSRRFPAAVVFDQPGTMTQVRLKDGREIALPPTFSRPGSVLVLEAFQVESGRIRAINAVLDFCQYGIQPGWLL